MEKKDMPMHKKAKLDVLKDLRKMAMEMLHDQSSEGMEEGEMPSKMQKVMVAAKDKEGLKQGLEKAEDVLESMPGEESEEDEEEGMASEKSLDEQEQELLAKLEEIRAKKQA
jgi:hypothetical protein